MNELREQIRSFVAGVTVDWDQSQTGRTIDQATDRLLDLIAERERLARIEGEIKGLSTYAQLDEESFRKNTKWMKVDSSKTLKKIAELYAELNSKKAK